MCNLGIAAIVVTKATHRIESASQYSERSVLGTIRPVIFHSVPFPTGKAIHAHSEDVPVLNMTSPEVQVDTMGGK